MYFSGRGENNIYSTLKSTLINEKFDSWLGGLSDALEVSKFDAFEQVGGMIAGIAEAAEAHEAANSSESEAESDTSGNESSETASDGAESSAESESGADSASASTEG